MVKGLDTFQKYFADYEEQYVLKQKRKDLGEKVDSSDIKKHKKMFCVLLRSLCLKK